MDARDENLVYLHLPAGSALPTLDTQPRRIVVLVSQQVTCEWQYKVSDWIVQTGCLYMMAWGMNCSSWDDSVDHANRKAFEPKEIPDENFVMTTWHAGEPMAEAFFFCRSCAFHPDIDLPNVVLLDINLSSRRDELIDRYWHSFDEIDTATKATLRSRLTAWFNRTIKMR